MVDPLIYSERHLLVAEPKSYCKLSVGIKCPDEDSWAVPRNDPLKVPVEPLLLLTSARIQIEEDNGGADTNVNILEDSV